MKNLLMAIIVLMSLFTSVSLATELPARAAVDVFKTCNITTANGERPTVCEEVDRQNAAKTNPIIGILRVALNILSVVAGIAAVILLIVNGLRLVLTNGDTNGVKNARSGIIYVLIGVLIVIVAQSIVIFVLDKL